MDGFSGWKRINMITGSCSCKIDKAEKKPRA